MDSNNSGHFYLYLSEFCSLVPNKDIEIVMMDIMEGMDPKDAAKKWIKENEAKVAEWTKEAK